MNLNELECTRLLSPRADLHTALNSLFDPLLSFLNNGIQTAIRGPDAALGILANEPAFRH